MSYTVTVIQVRTTNTTGLVRLTRGPAPSAVRPTHGSAHLLTHGLVLAADGGGVVKDEDVSLKLPAGLGVQCRVNQNHSLADLAPLVLHTVKGTSSFYS